MSSDDPVRLGQIIAFFRDLIPFNRYIGFDIIELRPGFARAVIPFRAELVGDPTRPALHGGVLASAIDAAGGAAAAAAINLPDDRLSTIDLRVDFLHPAELADVHFEANIVRLGNRIATIDVVCFHPDAPERHIATGKAVYSIKRSSAKAPEQSTSTPTKQ